MATLLPLEHRLLAAEAGASPRPIFLIGSPRSGTTLLYEAMITRYQFAYISNVAHRLYRTPAAATHLASKYIRAWTGRFESRYGHISGWGSPNEGGWVWRRWIPEEHALTEVDIADRPAQVMRRTVASIARTLEAPFISKNVMHSVQMRLLDRIYPGCLFIDCRRDVHSTARSMLKVRLDERGPSGVHCWISVRPDGWQDMLHASPGEQVVWQVVQTRLAIECDAAIVGRDRIIQQSYESLCENPESALRAIGEFLRRHGVLLKDRHELPSAFSSSTRRPLESAFETQLRDAIGKWCQPSSCGQLVLRAGV